MRKVFKSFEIFSKPYGLVGELNQPVHWVRFAGKAVWVLCFVCVRSWSFGVIIALRLSCWIPEFVRKVNTSFEMFSQPYGSVWKPNQPVHWVQFVGKANWVLCFVCVGSWSIGVRIAPYLSFWIPDFVRKVLKSFKIFSQPDGPVGKPNHLVYYVMFVRKVVWVLYFVCVGSWSFEVGIALRLSCWIPDSVRKVFKSFEIFSQPYGSVGKSSQPVHWVKFSETTA